MLSNRLIYSPAHPKVISVGRERVKTSTLFAPVTFECLGEGNPPPTYQWIQTKTSQQSDSVIERGREAKLHIRNVTYEYQGELKCKVTNVIKGEEQSDISEHIMLQVYGAPQVLRHTATPEIFVESGQTVDLSMVVCADPRLRSIAWEWGSLRLEAGNEMGKFKVDDVTQEEGEDCYLTTLHVKDTSATDSKTYYLLVENDKGRDTHAVQLYVNVLYYSSRKLDIEKTAHHHQLTNNQNSHPPSLGPGGIHADALYTTGPRGGNHPDAMKVRLASMVLQPPTEV
ncbi:unnamed protein product [Ceutorhynchus assimilis]|uniref:Ig-like domain-containing protein n=1 Tax=Ceutorhynchus assimilis TaxID=467358 RepID=A0A9N9QLN8_9CUCU|nr:unnamed protein product [Ceutorhynchus assimilis]